MRFIKDMRKRLLFLSLFFVFLHFSLIFKLYNLQIKKNSYFSARAESQNRLAGFLAAVRGNIYFTDKYGNSVPAAINKEYPVIFAIPKEIENPRDAAKQLILALNLDETKLIAALSKENDPYEPILKKATADQAQKVKELNLKGIYVDGERFRFYPFQDLAAHVLGFVAPSADDSALLGRYGTEAYFNKELSGKGGKVEGDKITEAESGKPITLTIDPNIQQKAEDLLLNLVQKYSAESGTVIVQEPKTGKILALGNYPTFDPNNYSDFNLGNFLNPAVQSIYEPGSIFKIITMAAGLNSKKFTPQTTFIDKGFVKMDGKIIKNWDLKAHGEVTMTQVIEQSINTGAVYAGQLIGKDLFYNYLVNFGFDEKTGIELPGEVSGDIKNLRVSLQNIDFATASFGQGVAISPIELINAASVIANGGTLMTPYITADTKPKAMRQVISKEAARQVTEMMVSAVKTAKVAQVPNYNVAGKTGTAQIPDQKCGGYCDDLFIHSYIGFVPAYNPSFIILLKLNKPNVSLAGLTVVPAFREMAEFVLNYYNIPPDYVE